MIYRCTIFFDLFLTFQPKNVDGVCLYTLRAETHGLRIADIRILRLCRSGKSAGDVSDLTVGEITAFSKQNCNESLQILCCTE